LQISIGPQRSIITLDQGYELIIKTNVYLQILKICNIEMHTFRIVTYIKRFFVKVKGLKPNMIMIRDFFAHL